MAELPTCTCMLGGTCTCVHVCMTAHVHYFDVMFSNNNYCQRFVFLFQRCSELLELSQNLTLMQEMLPLDSACEDLEVQ